MSQQRRYNRHVSVVFRKTKEQWGGLSNMAGGYPLVVNDIKIQSSELLYQAIRFTDHPEIQEEILSQRNPMWGKSIARSHDSLTRSDWDSKRVVIMKWVLWVKLCQNWDTFSTLLLSTGDKPIVEYSPNDPFWGAEKYGGHAYQGMNVLGRLLMQLREVCDYKGQAGFRVIPPLAIEKFHLLNQPVQNVVMPDTKEEKEEVKQLALF